MERRINYYWQQLNQKYAPDQVFFIMTYWAFAVYPQELRGDAGPESFEEWRGSLLLSFKESLDYDVKEAAVRLGDRIDWSSLIKDMAAKKTLMAYEAELRRYLRGTEYGGRHEMSHMQRRFYSWMEILFDMASVYTSYLTTPKSIRTIVGKLFTKQEIWSMADICCGYGGLGVAVWQNLNKREQISYYGMDMEPVMCDVSRLMLYLCGVSRSQVVWQNVLESYSYGNDAKFDLVLLDVPRGQNKNVPVVEARDWLIGNKQRTIFADWIYILKALDVMNENGKGVVIVTPGSLARKNEAMLRRKLIERDWIEAVITLPVNLYPGSRTGSEMIIFNKNKNMERAGGILFIDIGQYYYRDNRNYYSVSEAGMGIIWDAYSQYCSIPMISNVISVSQIDRDTWSLKPMRYIEGQRERSYEPTISLSEIAMISRGVQLKKEEEEYLSRKGSALLLNIKDIRDGEIHYEDANKITPKSFDWQEKFRIQEDDIIITSKGTNFKIAIVGENPPEAYVCGNLTILRVDPRVYHPYILLEYLTSPEGMRALESIQSGTTIRILNNANLGSLQIPVYRKEVADPVGEHLKSKRKKYLQEMRHITEQYAMERRVLLEMIGINE